MALHPSFLARTPSVVAHTAGRLSASFASGPTALGLALQRLARTGLLCPSLARTSSSLSGLRNGSENNRSPCPDSNWAPLSSPPPAHPSTASTPPSPDRSAPDDKPTAPHRSFPPSASRSGRFPRSASTRSHSPQDRFFVSPRISVSRGPGTCRRFFLSLHKSCRPARLTFASEAGAPDRAVDRCLLYSHPHVGAR